VTVVAVLLGGALPGVVGALVAIPHRCRTVVAGKGSSLPLARPRLIDAELSTVLDIEPLRFLELEARFWPLHD
jgi:hypothetical protein